MQILFGRNIIFAAYILDIGQDGTQCSRIDPKTTACNCHCKEARTIDYKNKCKYVLEWISLNKLKFSKFVEHQIRFAPHNYSISLQIYKHTQQFITLPMGNDFWVVTSCKVAQFKVVSMIMYTYHMQFHEYELTFPLVKSYWTFIIQQFSNRISQELV